MVLTQQKAEELYGEGKYRELIAAWEEWKKTDPATAPLSRADLQARAGPWIDLRIAWAYYQLGEYVEAERIAVRISRMSASDTEPGESARRLLAHCAERQGRLDEAEEQLRTIPASRSRDNLYLTILISRKRRGGQVSAITAMNLVTEALIRAPYQTVDGHIINNAAWLFYEGRQDEMVVPFLPILPGLIEVAIGIYEATDTAPNHRAGALFRASHIFLDVADWPKGALVVIEESIALWERLVSSEGGERYQQNLAGAQSQRSKILARLNS